MLVAAGATHDTTLMSSITLYRKWGGGGRGRTAPLCVRVSINVHVCKNPTAFSVSQLHGCAGKAKQGQNASRSKIPLVSA